MTVHSYAQLWKSLNLEVSTCILLSSFSIFSFILILCGNLLIFYAFAWKRKSVLARTIFDALLLHQAQTNYVKSLFFAGIVFTEAMFSISVIGVSAYVFQAEKQLRTPNSTSDSKISINSECEVLVTANVICHEKSNIFCPMLQSLGFVSLIIFINIIRLLVEYLTETIKFANSTQRKSFKLDFIMLVLRALVIFIVCAVKWSYMYGVVLFCIFVLYDFCVSLVRSIQKLSGVMQRRCYDNNYGGLTWTIETYSQQYKHFRICVGIGLSLGTPLILLTILYSLNNYIIGPWIYQSCWMTVLYNAKYSVAPNIEGYYYVTSLAIEFIRNLLLSIWGLAGIVLNMVIMLIVITSMDRKLREHMESTDQELDESHDIQEVQIQ